MYILTKSPTKSDDSDPPTPARSSMRAESEEVSVLLLAEDEVAVDWEERRRDGKEVRRDWSFVIWDERSSIANWRIPGSGSVR
jgi:hypothetical protein